MSPGLLLLVPTLSLLQQQPELLGFSLLAAHFAYPTNSVGLELVRVIGTFKATKPFTSGHALAVHDKEQQAQGCAECGLGLVF